MKWSLCVASMVVLFVAGSLPAGAEVFTGELSGAAEDPPRDSTGTGNAEVELDPVQHVLRVDVSFSGLVSPTTIAHIHCCAPPGESGSVATAVPSFPGFPTDVMSGTYQMTFDTTLASTFNPAFITSSGGTPAAAEAVLLDGLNNGMAYFNVHTVMFGGGEIRADLVAGEPTTPTATPTATVTLPAGTASATITPPATPTATGEATATVTAIETALPTVTGQATATATGIGTALPTRTATPPGGSPTTTSGTPASTATATQSGGATGSPVRTRTGVPGGGGNQEDDSCAIVAPQRSGVGGALFLLVPAALLVVARRRHS